MSQDISLKTLIETGAHFGHQTRRWNPKMGEYIYGAKDGIHIFDLTKSKEKLEEALQVLRKAAKEGKKIIFVGTKKQAKEKIKEVALATDSFYVNERWLGGTITNFDQIKKSIYKMEEMKVKMEKGEYKNLTKKERLLKERDIQKLERFLGGVSKMERVPELMVVVDTKREKGALIEAMENGVETIGIVDTNSDPNQVTYPVPMNDDASKAIDYVLTLMQEAISGSSKSEAPDEVSKSPKKTFKVGKAPKKTAVTKKVKAEPKKKK